MVQAIWGTEARMPHRIEHLVALDSSGSSGDGAAKSADRVWGNNQILREALRVEKIPTKLVGYRLSVRSTMLRTVGETGADGCLGLRCMQFTYGLQGKPCEAVLVRDRL